MVNKIFITGPVGSGKSTLARQLAKDFGFVYCELDIVIHKPDSSSESGSRKRPDAERDELLASLLSNSRWVAEDTGRAFFETAWKQADSIILLEPHVKIRKYRILLRWVKQNLRLEKCGYKPNLKMLRMMFKWTKSYETGTDTLKKRLAAYNQKVSVLRTEKDIRRYISEYLRG